MESKSKARGVFPRLIRLLLAALAVAYFGICLLVFVCQRQLLYHPVIRSPAQVDQLARAAHMERWFNTAGQSIGLKRLCTSQPVEGAVLMLYGNGDTAVRCADYADVLQQTAPLDFYVLEYPGYEDRPGPSTRETLLSAATEAFQRLDTNKPIYLVGESLGTGPASYLAGKFPDKIAGVMLLSPYDHLAEVAQSHYPILPTRWLLLDDFYSAKYLQTYHGPVGIMIDGRDTVVPPQFGQRLYDGFTGPKHLWQFPDANHIEVGEPAEIFWKSVVEFWHVGQTAKTVATNN